MTDLILLATLLDGPKHGYQLKKQAGMIFGHWAIHNNLVYPLMRRFTAEGWASKKTVPGERGQNKQQYAITAVGRKALVEKLSDFDDEAARSVEGFRIRVALLGMLPGGTQAKILDARERALREQDARLEGLEQVVQLSVYPAEVVKFMRKQLAGEMVWVRRLQKIQGKARANSKPFHHGDTEARRKAS
jgi:DNA-binding PadR family transcriptional regulator